VVAHAAAKILGFVPPFSDFQRYAFAEASGCHWQAKITRSHSLDADYSSRFGRLLSDQPTEYRQRMWPPCFDVFAELAADSSAERTYRPESLPVDIPVDNSTVQIAAFSHSQTLAFYPAITARSLSRILLVIIPS